MDKSNRSLLILSAVALGVLVGGLGTYGAVRTFQRFAEERDSLRSERKAIADERTLLASETAELSRLVLSTEAKVAELKTVREGADAAIGRMELAKKLMDDKLSAFQKEEARWESEFDRKRNAEKLADFDKQFPELAKTPK